MQVLEPHPDMAINGPDTFRAIADRMWLNGRAGVRWTAGLGGGFEDLLFVHAVRATLPRDTSPLVIDHLGAENLFYIAHTDAIMGYPRYGDPSDMCDRLKIRSDYGYPEMLRALGAGVRTALLELYAGDRIVDRQSAAPPPMTPKPIADDEPVLRVRLTAE